jgi:hypothetical protein
LLIADPDVALTALLDCQHLKRFVFEFIEIEIVERRTVWIGAAGRADRL